MRNHIISRIGPVSIFLLASSVACGYASVVVPVPPSDHEMALDDGHGLLLGTNNFAMSFRRNGRDHAPDFKHSHEMEWHIEEVTRGKRSLTVHLPVDGSFVVRLPVGSYRVTNMRFRSSGGIWHTVLPTAFEIRPGECTSLGTSMFQLQVGFVTGWISRHVLNAQEPTGTSQDPLIGGNKCSTSMVRLRSSVKHPVKLERYEAQK